MVLDTKIKSIDLSWIVVSDIKKATSYFTDVIGLKVTQSSIDQGWVELAGHNGGTVLGLAQAQTDSLTPIPAGGNAVVTFTVENISKTKDELVKKGVKMLGDVLEVPGHVKLQFFADQDGNRFQLVQDLSRISHMHKGCCKH